MLGLQTPVELVDRVLPGLPFDSRSSNNRRAAMLATNHILEFGQSEGCYKWADDPLGRSRPSAGATALRSAVMVLAYDQRFVRDGQFS